MQGISKDCGVYRLSFVVYVDKEHERSENRTLGNSRFHMYWFRCLPINNKQLSASSMLTNWITTLGCYHVFHNGRVYVLIVDGAPCRTPSGNPVWERLFEVHGRYFGQDPPGWLKGVIHKNGWIGSRVGKMIHNVFENNNALVVYMWQKWAIPAYNLQVYIVYPFWIWPLCWLSASYLEALLR